VGPFLYIRDIEKVQNFSRRVSKGGYKRGFLISRGEIYIPQYKVGMGVFVNFVGGTCVSGPVKILTTLSGGGE